MKTVQISDELYDRLKSCIVDPFDDTPESVITRLIDIVDKSKNRCSSWDVAEDPDKPAESQRRPTHPAKPSTRYTQHAEQGELVL
jgi:hypothetical protein